LFHEEEEEEVVVVGVVVGMEYLVSLADVGCKFFCFFRTRSRWMEYFVYLADVGMQVCLCFHDDEEVEIDEEEEEGNHLRKEPVPYCVNYKESVS
jgi:hypothetical protein